MTTKEWLEQRMDEARKDVGSHEAAVEVIKARYNAYMDMWKNLSEVQMETQIAGEDPAKE
jgi:uncharacterized protein involved in exopolysaccharide biosynthesis